MKISTSLMLAGAIVLLTSQVRADATIKRVMHLQVGDREVRSTDLLKNGRLAQTSVTVIKGATPETRKTFRIIDLGVDRFISTDPAAKTYTERTVKAGIDEFFDSATSMWKVNEDAAKATYKVAGSTLTTVRSDAKRVIAGFPCESREITLLIELTSDQKSGANTLKFPVIAQVWETPATGALAASAKEEKDFRDAVVAKSGHALWIDDYFLFDIFRPVFGMTAAVLEGPMAKLRAAIDRPGYFPVLTEVSWPGRPQTTGRQLNSGAAEALLVNPRKGGSAAPATPAKATALEVLSVKSVALDDKLFSIPEGYAKK